MSDLNKFEEAISRHIAADLYYAATINSKESAVAMAELDILRGIHCPVFPLSGY